MARNGIEPSMAAIKDVALVWADSGIFVFGIFSDTVGLDRHFLTTTEILIMGDTPA